MKRRRRQQEQRSRRSAATQSSQTGDDWNSFRSRGIENFALNGDLDGFAGEFMNSPVHLPPYDFSSAYHKPRPRIEDSDGDRAEGERSENSETAVDAQSIPVNEDPPPYSDQRYEGSRSPPSYDEALKGLAITVEECTSGL